MQLAGGGQPNHTLTRRLVACGALAGPLFTLAWLVEGATRAGYDPLRHPISSLAIGEFGWMQSATFLATGALTLACAVGLRRALPPPDSSRWGPVLIGLIAIGLVGAGLFVTDPLAGYPPGTPALPLQPSVPGRLHRLFSALVFVGWPLACLVFGRLFARWGAHRWARYSALTGITFVGLFVLTSVGFAQVAGLGRYAGFLQRLTLTIGWLWLTWLCLTLPQAPARRTVASARMDGQNPPQDEG